MEELLFNARAQHGAGLLTDAIETLNELVSSNPALGRTARNVFGQIYKDKVDPIRANLKTLSSAISYEEGKKNIDLADKISIYKAKLLTELETLCNSAIALIDEKLLPNATDAASQVFFEKMRGDMYRYIDEHVDNGSREKAREAYEKAIDIAKKSLPAFHPVRLGAFLNYAVFTYEHLGHESEAINMLREALLGIGNDEVVDDMTQQTREEAMDVMRVMQTNLANWVGSDAEEEEEEEDRNE